MKLTVRVPFALLAANLIGAVVYLLRVRHSWANPVERDAGIYSVTGEPFAWASAGFPILGLFLLLNLGWIAYLIRQKQWLQTYALSVVVSLWMIALAIDFAHH